MARMGMDVDQVAAAGNALKQRAADIDTLVSKIDGIVRSMPGVWDGPDAQQFMNEWWPEHKKTLVAASSHVAGLGQSALNNASEQRQASETNGDGGTSTPTAPAASPSTSSTPSGPVGALPPPDVDAYRRFEQDTKRWYQPKDGEGFYVDGNGSATNQCTSWAEYRRSTLDPPLPTKSGDGGEMAGILGGTTSTSPSLGAAVSYYPNDNSLTRTYGHVMIVEEILSANPPTIRVSQDNPRFDSQEVWTQQTDGQWTAKNKGPYPLVISPPA